MIGLRLTVEALVEVALETRKFDSQYSSFSLKPHLSLSIVDSTLSSLLFSRSFLVHSASYPNLWTSELIYFFPLNFVFLCFGLVWARFGSRWLGLKVLGVRLVMIGW